jgi:hypothetical protein
VGDRLIHIEFGVRNLTDDMQIPPANIDAYRTIYRLENWLRRICLTAYMCVYGSDWPAHLDPRLRNSLARRVHRNSDRLYLNAESDDNLIWLTMYGELHSLLRHEEVWQFVQQRLRLSQTAVDAKLSELNDIRNLLAHNRALTSTTSDILTGLSASLELGIRNFKSTVVYGDYDILGDDDEIGAYVELLDRNEPWRFQAYVARNQDLYEFVTLPVERFGQDWLSIATLLKTFSSISHLILAYCMNLEGSEYRVLLPRSLSHAELRSAAQRFFSNPYVWTTRPYESQPLQYTCNPKVWFYENTYPDI